MHLDELIFQNFALKVIRNACCVIRRMLLMRKFTGLVIPVNYAAWGVPSRKTDCRCLDDC
jgi:hypothetical protein